MKRSSWPLAVLAVCVIDLVAVAAHGDDGIRSLQTTLKSRGYLYGSPSGAMDEETHSAIRRLQIHDGLAVTGEFDAATAKALGAAAPNSAKPAAPTTILPAARGVSAGSPQEGDRDFAHPPVAAAPVDRIRVQPTPEPVIAAALRPPPPAAPARTPRPPKIESEVNALVEKYLASGAGLDVEAEINLYADQIDYFNNGLVNRGFIRRDTTNYRHRWPRRDYLLDGKPAIMNASPDGNSATVRFRIRYQVRAGLQHAAGHTESTMRIVRGDDGTLRVVSIKETPVPRSG